MPLMPAVVVLLATAQVLIRCRCGHAVLTLPLLAEAAGDRPVRVVAALPVSVTDDVDGARAQAAKQFAMYGHLPSYRAMLDRASALGELMRPEDGALAAAIELERMVS